MNTFLNWVDTFGPSCKENLDRHDYLKETIQKIFAELKKIECRGNLSSLLKMELSAKLCQTQNLLFSEEAKKPQVNKTESLSAIPIRNIPFRFFSTPPLQLSVKPFREFSWIPPAKDPSSDFLEAGALAFSHLPFKTRFGLSRVCRQWYNLFNESLKVNRLVYFVLYGTIDVNLAAHIRNEKMMTEFAEWLESLSLDLLDRTQSAISDNIDEMLLLLCCSKDEKFSDLVKIMLRIYCGNGMKDSTKNVVRTIFKGNWVGMLYNIVAYSHKKDLHFSLRDVVREVWEEVFFSKFIDHAAILIEIGNLCLDPKEREIDNLPTLIAFLEMLNKENFDLTHLIDECSRERELLEKSFDDLIVDVKQKEIQRNEALDKSNNVKKLCIDTDNLYDDIDTMSDIEEWDLMNEEQIMADVLQRSMEDV